MTRPARPTPPHRRNVITSVLLAALAFPAAALAQGLPAPPAVPAAPPPAREARLPVVASFSILADFARQVGGERVEVSALVGPDGDAHAYQPTPADARRLAGARLVLVNGLGFEGWIDRLVRASGTKALVATATRGITPAMTEGEGHGHSHGHGHAHADRTDPHAWQSVANAKVYLANVRDALAQADPAGAAAYAANAERAGREMDALEAEVRAAVAAIPEGRRRVVTTHDAFGYFGRAYGFRFLAPEGAAREGEASARDVARIIRQVKAEKVPAVFLENVSNPRLIERIAKEGGARVGGKLYSDALSAEGGPAPTYAAMMRHNISALRAALAP